VVPWQQLATVVVVVSMDQPEDLVLDRV